MYTRGKVLKSQSRPKTPLFLMVIDPRHDSLEFMGIVLFDAAGIKKAGEIFNDWTKNVWLPSSFGEVANFVEQG